MASNLVIVESPAKATTIKKYLGKDFEVLASYGHVRDLLPKEGAVDPERDFEMKYQVIDKNSKYVEAIARAMKKANALYLATDLDREGEAISWHLVELLRERSMLDGKDIHRVVFHEITERAIKEAIASPRAVSMDLVNAQQARRALDYLVGFNLSPLLWKKIKRGLSAGRVQSPALRLICEREAEIEKFKRREYWTIEADARAGGARFSAKLYEYEGEKVRQFTVTSADRAAAVPHRVDCCGEWRAHRQSCRKETAQAQSRASVHHLDLAAGRREKARVHRAAHHAHRATALRRHRHRLGYRRSHYLYAHGFSESCSGSGGRNPPVHRRQVR